MRFLKTHRIAFIFTALAVIVIGALVWASQYRNPATIKTWVDTAAIIVTAIWVYFRFSGRREHKPALEIKLATNCIPVRSNSKTYVVSFDVELTNKSTRRVLARVRESQVRKVKVDTELLLYCCSLQIRRVQPNEPEKQIQWQFPTGDNLPPEDETFNLIEDYEYEKPGEEDYWLEPNESSHLCVGAHLERGVYHVMITFVGSKDEEFWRRMFFIDVSNAPSTQPVKGPG